MIIVAEAGESQNNNKTMNTNQFSLANRKQPADMLGRNYDSLRSKAKDTLRDKREALLESLIKEHAEKKGAFKALALIKAARAKLKEQERELSQLGFSFYDDDDDDVRRAGGDAGRTLRKLIEAQIDKELGTSNDIDARFDSIQVAMMTVASLEDADKILKSVSTI
jgi:hypothetical protein